MKKIIDNSKPKIGKDAEITDSSLGKYVIVNNNCVVLESTIGDYSYCNGYNQIMYAEIGKFASIAWGCKNQSSQSPNL